MAVTVCSAANYNTPRFLDHEVSYDFKNLTLNHTKVTRRKFTPAFKAKGALEATKNDQTLAELTKKFEATPP